MHLRTKQERVKLQDGQGFCDSGFVHHCPGKSLCKMSYLGSKTDLLLHTCSEFLTQAYVKTASTMHKLPIHTSLHQSDYFCGTFLQEICRYSHAEKDKIFLLNDQYDSRAVSTMVKRTKRETHFLAAMAAIHVIVQVVDKLGVP